MGARRRNRRAGADGVRPGPGPAAAPGTGRNAEPGRLGTPRPRPPYGRSRTRRGTPRRRAEIPAGPGRVRGKGRASPTRPKPPRHGTTGPDVDPGRSGSTREAAPSPDRSRRATEPPGRGPDVAPPSGRTVRPLATGAGQARIPAGPGKRGAAAHGPRPPREEPPEDLIPRTAETVRRRNDPARTCHGPERVQRVGAVKGAVGGAAPDDRRRQRRATPSARAATATAAVTAGATRSSNGDGMT